MKKRIEIIKNYTIGTDLVKVDSEGSELEIVRGMAECIGIRNKKKDKLTVTESTEKDDVIETTKKDTLQEPFPFYDFKFPRIRFELN